MAKKEPEDELDVLPEAWERLPSETPPAFAAFVAFRDLPPLERGIPRLASDSGVARKQLSIWRKHYNWDWRVQEWDEEVDRKRRDELIFETTREAARVVQEAGEFQIAFAVGVKEFMRRYQSEEASEDKIKFNEELKGLSLPQLLALINISARPYGQMWELQKEALGVTIQHLIVQRKSEGGADPFQTDDDFFEKVVAAWEEAGILRGDIQEPTPAAVEADAKPTAGQLPAAKKVAHVRKRQPRQRRRIGE